MRNKRAVVVSTNYSDNYFFFLPLIHFAWQKIGWDVICMMPGKENKKRNFVLSSIIDKAPYAPALTIITFSCSEENEVLYTQCSRLYAGNLAVPEYEVIMTGDVDMLPLSNYWNPARDKITVYGKDLSDEHYPICYAAASPEKWREIMSLTGNVTMDIDCDLDYYTIVCTDKWVIDQEILTASLGLYHNEIVYVNRGKSPHSDYPIGRIDRSAWVASHKETERIDCHMPRKGYSNENWPLVLNEIKENLNPTEEEINWLEQYRNDYIKIM